MIDRLWFYKTTAFWWLIYNKYYMQPTQP